MDDADVTPFVAHYSKRKLWLAILGALAFVGLSLFVLTRRQPSFLDIAGGTATLVFFGLCAAILAVRLRDRRAVLVIDRRGLFDRRIKDRQLPWSQIAHIGTTHFGRQRLWVVQPSVPLKGYIDRRHKRILAALNRPWTHSGFFVGASGLDVTFEQIGAAIRHYRDQTGS